MRKAILRRKCQQMKRNYLFEYYGSVDINDHQSELCYITFSADGIFLCDRERNLGNETYNGKIYHRRFDDGGGCKPAVDNIPLKISVLGACYIRKNNTLVYVESNPMTRLRGVNMRSGEQSVFELPEASNLINIACLNYDQRYDDVFAIDTFSHILLNYSLDGKLLRSYEFDETMQFPNQMVRLNEREMLISFLQDIPLMSRSKFAKTHFPSPYYLVRLDLVSGRYSLLATNWHTSSENRPIYFMAGKKTGELFFITDAKYLSKKDVNMKHQFSVNLEEAFSEIHGRKGTHGGSRLFLSSLKICQERLYIAETRAYKEVIAFRI